MNELKKEKLLNKIVNAIEEDISDRRGLKQEWEQIDKEVQELIKKDWKKIIDQQIVELIQKPEKDEQLDAQFVKLLEEAKRLGVGEKEFIDNVLKKYKQKPEVTEEWIEEKARNLQSIMSIIERMIIQNTHNPKEDKTIFKDFIRSLVGEIHGKK